jgi:DnaK suppressor protein
MATKAKKPKGKVVKSSKAKPLKKAVKAISNKKKTKPVKAKAVAAKPAKKKVVAKKVPAKKAVATKIKKVIKKAPLKKIVKPIVKPKVLAKKPVKAVVKPAVKKVAPPKAVAKIVAKVSAPTPTPSVKKLKASVAQATVKKKSALTTRKPVMPPREAIDWSKIDLKAEILPYQEQPGEDYMGEKQRVHFRRILLQRKQQMMDEMGRVVHNMHDEVATNLADPNDRATQEEEFSLELRTRDRERKFIKNIEDALQKLDEGEYGYCDACGIEIGIRRLEARPTADLCIDCKTLDELREKQLGGA